MVHHLDNGKDIYENSLDEKEGSGHAILPKLAFQSSQPGEGSHSLEPPYSKFEIHMDNLTDASVRLKIWQDKTFKDTKRRASSKL